MIERQVTVRPTGAARAADIEEVGLAGALAAETAAAIKQAGGPGRDPPIAPRSS